MPRKDKIVTPSVTTKIQQLGYNVADWDDSKSNLPNEIIEVLQHASKEENGNEGYPDRIFCDKSNKLLILVEEKPNLKDHDKPDIKSGAIAGIKWYLSKFLSQNLENPLLFKQWKILGIAVSGNVLDNYQFLFNCYTLNDNRDDIVNVNQITNFVSEEDFLSIFENFDEENAVSRVSASSKKINKLLRSIDSQKRPILLSALMICLHNGKDNNFSAIYETYNNDILADNIPIVAEKVLSKENIPMEKINVLKSELSFLSTDQSLRSTDVLKKILKELNKEVIPLFERNTISLSNYDIIGKFYEEFLKYAGVSNVKKGIVLTPRHISTLFTDLIDIKEDDKILDLCCGTGSLLIAGLNRIINKINSGDRVDKQEAMGKVKENQLLGFEINPTMYICAISNMLFRGDGKSSIYNMSSIGDERADKLINDFGATIGLINPPYSGKENEEDPTPKEITFITKLLDSCSRFCVIIAPLSVYFKDKTIRNNILKKHTLKYVINMPADLFQPNASTYTAISVFETHKAFDYNNDEVVFYNLEDDGFVLSKNKGRTDIYNKWNNIKKNLLSALKDNSCISDGVRFIRTKIHKNDEWTIFAHGKTDYSSLSIGDFENTVGEYLIYLAKKKLGILGQDLSQYEMFKILSNYYKNDVSWEDDIGDSIDISNWKEFPIFNSIEKVGVFDTIEDTKGTTTYELLSGNDIPYIAAKKTDNGVMYYVAKDGNENYISEGNGLVFINLGDGSGGYSIYQPDEFIGMSGKTSVGYSKKLNKYNALFIVTMLDKARYKYCFGRSWTGERFESTKVLLPVDKNGNPDWEYMEQFIKQLNHGKDI